MANRAELVCAYVLNEISDDLEEIRQIMVQLRWVAYLGISRAEVREALVSLVQDGLARSYDLYVSQETLPGLPPRETFDEHYFYITPKGLELLRTFPEEWFPGNGSSSPDQ